ncbi:MAG: MEDS domain-containing protein [Candidatus Bathyarchaeota archaeon]|nr:MAG: MEDS domain-containing protein [Candidatus Bathyarchaeota archaeon]
MPKLPIINPLRQRLKRAIPSDILKAGPVLNLKEGEIVIVTYTSAADKMKVFSAFVREGLENGDAVYYTCPDKEMEIVRAKLKEHGIDAKKYEKDDTLHMNSLTEHFMSNDKLHIENAVQSVLDYWNYAKRKGYKHIRTIEDVGDFSFLKGQWQKYVADYWYHPKWSDPVRFPEWVKTTEPVGVVYVPLLMEITAINVEGMGETQIADLLKAFGKGTAPAARFIDLIEETSSFSRSMNLNHEQLIGRKILLEFDPVSDYEKTVDCLAKESMANVEPIFVFTSKTSSIHSRLTEESAIKFFLSSVSTSIPKSTSENTVFLPANNVSLVLDAINKVLETSGDANICFVFDILSEMLTSAGREKTYLFLNHALNMLASGKVTALFLLNPSAHESQVVSSLRRLFSNQLVYGKNGLEATKTS